MYKCSYIILISNNENTIPQLIQSLNNINGNFRREFVFIDHASSDRSMEVLKNSISHLPNTTIITHQNTSLTQTVNQSLKLINGDYVHFVQGNEQLQPDATLKLVQCCIYQCASVAIGNVAGNNCSPSSTEQIIVKPTPVREVLENSILGAQNVGLSASLVERQLLEKVGYSDESVYNHHLSLSLRCASQATFAFLKDIISTTNKHTYNNPQQNFEIYDHLLTILNFARNHIQLCKEHKTAILYVLYNYKHIKSNNTIRSTLCKKLAQFRSKQLSLHCILEHYESMLTKLF